MFNLNPVLSNYLRKILKYIPKSKINLKNHNLIIKEQLPHLQFPEKKLFKKFLLLFNKILGKNHLRIHKSNLSNKINQKYFRK